MSSSDLPPTDELSAQAQSLAYAIERNLAASESGGLSPDALQSLMAALCKTYAAQVAAGAHFMPLRHRESASSTDIMTLASGLLKSANLATFELGMWQNWTGR